MRNQNVIIKNLTLAETIAHRNPEIANEMLVKNGFPPSRDRDELASRINTFLLQYRDKALKELASIHPDKALLFSNFSEDLQQAQDNVDGFGDTSNAEGDDYAVGMKRGIKNKAKQQYSNCCGSADGEFSNCAGGPCPSCAMKAKYSSADGKQSTGIPTQALFNREMMAIVGIIALTGIVLMAFNKKS